MAAFENAMDKDPMMYLQVDKSQAMREQAKTFDAKKWVWVPVKEMAGYVAAQVKSASGDKVTVETQDGKVRGQSFSFFSNSY